MSAQTAFSYAFPTLQQLAEDVLKHARNKGATACDVDVSEGFGQTVGVRCGEVDLGTIICYERHFPELGRLVALAGGAVMAVPVACASAPTREVFQIELRAQAIFNELFVVCANRVGTESGKTYYGTSGIYGPDGTVLAQASDDQPEVITAEVDVASVSHRRHVLPFLRDRRPDLYGRLTD